MSGILNSGKLSTLLSRLTAARAGYLDTINTNLNATITSRAAAADYTTARAAKLDNLDVAVSTVGNAAPTTNGLKGIPTSVARLGWGYEQSTAEVTDTSSTYNVWNEVLAESSASGILQIVAIRQDANASNLDWGARLSIDGNVVWSSANNLWNDTTDNNHGVCLIGDVVSDSYGSDEHLVAAFVPFSSSFSLEWRKNENSAGQIDVAVAYKYYLTG